MGKNGLPENTTWGFREGGGTPPLPPLPGGYPGGLRGVPRGSPDRPPTGPRVPRGSANSSDPDPDMFRKLFSDHRPAPARIRKKPKKTQKNRFSRSGGGKGREFPVCFEARFFQKIGRGGPKTLWGGQIQGGTPAFFEKSGFSRFSGFRRVPARIRSGSKKTGFSARYSSGTRVYARFSYPVQQADLPSRRQDVRTAAPVE